MVTKINYLKNRFSSKTNRYFCAGNIVNILSLLKKRILFFCEKIKRAYKGTMLDTKAHSETLYITGMRGYAALMVVSIHLFSALPDLSDTTKTILSYGPLGVVIFFVVSAYTICLTLDKKKPSYLEFVKRRFLRIAPAYYLILLIVFCLGLHSYWGDHFKNGFDLASLLAHMSFLNILSYEHQNNAIGVEWTLPLEFFYYLFLPAIFTLSKYRWGIAVIIITGIAMWFLDDINQTYINQPLEKGLANAWSPGRYYICFAIGVMAYRVRAIYPQIGKKFSGSPVTIFIISAAVAAIYISPQHYYHAPLAIVSIATALLLITGDTKNNAQQIIFENKAILYMGTISYSLYLYHMPVKEHFFPISTSAGIIMQFFISLTLGTLSYFYVEKRFLKK